ncbi:MAG: ATP-binding protein [Alphaproteobacteria bacterium]
MSKSYAISLLLLSLVLLAGTGIASRMLYQSNAAIEINSEWVRHSYEVIGEIEKLSSLAEGMVANERGYIMTANDEFLERYDAGKSAFIESATRIAEWVKDNPAQVALFKVQRSDFELFTEALEKNIAKYKGRTATKADSEFASGQNTIADIKLRIMKANADAIAQEKALLVLRRADLDKSKKLFVQMLVGGATGTVLMLFLFNAGLLHNHTRRLSGEKSLKETQERLALFLEGSNDGIFDWDIKTDTVFLSRQFFKLLGQDREAYTGPGEEIRELVHPDDRARAMQYLERYLHREVAEYSNTFRMKHANGGWIWVQSRATAVFGRNGEPLRLVGSHSDITLVKEYQQNLRREKLAAEKASRAKSDFLAHMSHEIRTPLTAISGVAEIFSRNQSNLDDKQRQLVKVLGLSSSSLKDLVNDILDFSKIESGELELKLETFYPADVFEQVATIMSVNAKEKGLAFALDCSTVRDFSFYGDRQRLRQIMINLVGNAIKFTEKGSVTVTVTRDDTAATLNIRIADTGIGIAAEDHQMVFERFKQADSSVSRKYQGTGLGLAISSSLAQLMGGRIALESAEGKGTVFTVILPIRQGGSVPADGSAALDKKISDRIKLDFSGESRLLVVEDYEGSRVVVGYILDELGYAYDIARNGNEALALWKERYYDLVLMDVQMPEMDGFAATKAIRAIEREKGLQPTAIIGMTAHALVGDKDKCREAGMDSYISKPIAEAELKGLILEYLKKTKGRAA